VSHPGDNLGLAVLRELLEKANHQGYLTTDDIIDILGQGDEDKNLLRKLIAYLSYQGVDIMEAGEEQGRGKKEPPIGEYDHASLEHVPPDDSTEIYFKEMASVPLLSFSQEVNLSKRIEEGRQAESRLKTMDSNEDLKTVASLEIIIQDGIAARDHLIKANTRLVVSIAKRYQGRGVPFLDLIQEGNLGLMKAVEKYDYRRGFRFSTYATWWIRQTISRAIADQGRTIRLPVHMSDRIHRLYRISHEMEQTLGRPPTIEELAKETGLPNKKVQWILQVSWIPLSLESPVGDEDDSELGMFVEDESTPSPSQITYENMLRERLDEALATLTPREARIIRLRFGLGNHKPCTLEELGAKFGLTRERIRQIEGKALRRLRHPCRVLELREYL
jgi:RNA polymerase primary sigma factor